MQLRKTNTQCVVASNNSPMVSLITHLFLPAYFQIFFLIKSCSLISILILLRENIFNYLDKSNIHTYMCLIFVNINTPLPYSQNQNEIHVSIHPYISL